MGWRTLTVNNQHFRWRAGKSNIVIQNENGKRISNPTLTVYEVKGIDSDIWEKQQHKHNTNNSIRPNDVAKYIRSHISI